MTTSKFEQVVYDFILEASTPIAHHSENDGNLSLLMTRKQRLPSGSFVNLPIVSGDTMRHGLRESAMRAYIDAANIGKMTAPAIRLLFSGGQITGSAGNSVSITEFSKMVDLCPPLALLGGCVNNRMVPGRLIVDEATLICDETLPTMPEWVRDWMSASGGHTTGLRSHVEEVMRVRMDPLSRPEVRMMLTDGERKTEEERLALSEKASIEGDAVSKLENKSTIMPRSFERVAAGSLFYWQVRANCYSELDFDTFHVMLFGFLGNAWVGGKRGTGHGNLKPVTARKLKISVEAADVDIGGIARRVGSVFKDHCASRSSEIAAFLEKVDA